MGAIEVNTLPLVTEPHLNDPRDRQTVASTSGSRRQFGAYILTSRELTIRAHNNLSTNRREEEHLSFVSLS